MAAPMLGGGAGALANVAARSMPSGNADNTGYTKQKGSMLGDASEADSEGFGGSQGGNFTNKAPWHQALDNAFGTEGPGGVVNTLLGYTAPVAIADTFAPEWAFNPTPEKNGEQEMEFNGDYSMPSAEQLDQLSDSERKKWQENAQKGLDSTIAAALAFLPGTAAAASMGEKLGLSHPLVGAEEAAAAYKAAAEEAAGTVGNRFRNAISNLTGGRIAQADKLGGARNPWDEVYMRNIVDPMAINGRTTGHYADNGVKLLDGIRDAGGIDAYNYQRLMADLMGARGNRAVAQDLNRGLDNLAAIDGKTASKMAEKAKGSTSKRYK